MVYVVPIIILIVLVFFAYFQWKIYSLLPKLSGDSDQHNERIYKDFEFFIKVFIALVGAVGYLRIEIFHKNEELARQAMIGIGSISLVTMTTISIFIICHQGSKIRRWKKVEWKNMLFWQEIWMVISMYLLATSLWTITFLW
jgi:hypothetical protein